MEREIVVVKYGSSTVANGEGMDHARLAGYAADLAAIQEKYDLIVVSSGAVACGKCEWGKDRSNEAMVSDRVAAMLGSAGVVMAWKQAFREHGIQAGQLLVTHDEIDNQNEGFNLKEALEQNLQRRVVTIANENDALSNVELSKLHREADNDQLAAHIARRIGASSLILMTDMEGILMNEYGRVYNTVGTDLAERSRAFNFVRDSISSLGKGGMRSKIKAAISAADMGTEAYIAFSGAGIEAIMAGKTGTHFVARHINR